jgi:predicted enzyme related to lactoylglutathione lyase
MMEIRTFNTIVYCKHFKNTVVFYKEKLKLQITTEREWFVEFKINETARLSIADASRASVGSCGGKGITITMEVKDIYSIHEHLENFGLHPTALRDHTWGAKVFYIYDPEGNRLEFWSETSA